MVGGCGFTRTEIAAELPSCLRSILSVPDVRPVIVEQANQIDRELGSNPRTVILCGLKKQDVEMNLGSAVASVGKRRRDCHRRAYPNLHRSLDSWTRSSLLDAADIRRERQSQSRRGYLVLPILTVKDLI